jgi:hypothetical protein
MREHAPAVWNEAAPSRDEISALTMMRQDFAHVMFPPFENQFPGGNAAPN